jgi:RNA polymerase sigma factor FliA
MISMQGVPSVLIAKNQSWVRKQAQALVRHLPANVERADLIQVGLIAVAQAAVSFEWEGDRDTAEAQEAFVRYARMRVKGAMLDELRQMDYLSRGERRKIKVVQIARERHRQQHGAEPNLTQLAAATGLSSEEISALLQADQMGRHQVNLDGDDNDEGGDQSHRFHPATPQEEVEARVDTGIVMRRLESFFADLPERERMVIDAYLGVGLTPLEVAKSLKVTPCHAFRRSTTRWCGAWPSTSATCLTAQPTVTPTNRRKSSRTWCASGRKNSTSSPTATGTRWSSRC